MPPSSSPRLDLGVTFREVPPSPPPAIVGETSAQTASTGSMTGMVMIIGMAAAGFVALVLTLIIAFYIRRRCPRLSAKGKSSAGDIRIISGSARESATAAAVAPVLEPEQVTIMNSVMEDDLQFDDDPGALFGITPGGGSEFATGRVPRRAGEPPRRQGSALQL